MSSDAARPIRSSLRRSSAPRHQALRFVANGAIIAAIYLGLGLFLSGPLGMPIQIAIPVSYVLSVLLNYCSQRWFVFAHNTGFALSGRTQLSRFLQLAAAQYALTATATALLPGLTGVDEQIVYVVTALVAAVVVFVTLRLAVFHGN
ncbi:MAG TPA: GtrA family protein [Baekduia sp.]|nr:GtrA family protein [Baekduia sp.]